MVYFLLWWRGNVSLIFFICEEVEVVFFFVCCFPIGQGFVVKEHNITLELFEIMYPGYPGFLFFIPSLFLWKNGFSSRSEMSRAQTCFLMLTNHSHGYSFDLIVSPLIFDLSHKNDIKLDNYLVKMHFSKEKQCNKDTL